MRVSSISSIALAAALLVPVTAHADKLKGFYVGSGGITPNVSRVVLVEFATDGTAIVQQNSIGKRIRRRGMPTGNRTARR